MPIHTTAIVDRRAEVDSTAEIGPYVIIDGPVRIGRGMRTYGHAFVSGCTVIGAGCVIHRARFKVRSRHRQVARPV